MTPQTETHGASNVLSAWLCQLAAHDGYSARADWQTLCPGQGPDQEQVLDG